MQARINRILITAIFLIIQFTFIYGQYAADAGSDKVVCVGLYGIDTVQIGGNPTATGGTPPYTYTWTANYVKNYGGYTWTFTASDFLNDTTLPNPLVVYQSYDFVDSVAFFLTVHDATGLVCVDTTVTRYSMLIYSQNLFIFDIQAGDSIYLNHGINAWSTFPTVSYLWKPNNGLSDSTSLSFWAKPEYSTYYYANITDSIGCVFQAPEYYHIRVIPVSISENKNDENSIFGIPNPAHETIQLNIKNENEHRNLKIIDFSGHKIKETELASGVTTVKINVSGWKRGSYIAIASCNGKIVCRGKFIVR